MMDVSTVSESQTDRGLTVLADTLERAAVPYWVDSGVLLGLRRDGALVAWEKDIDLAVAGSDVDSLLKAIPMFEDAGYVADVNRYRGRVYALGLKPSIARGTDDLRAGVHVYYHVRDHLVSPQAQIYVPPPAPDVLLGSRTFVGRVAKTAIDRWFYTEPATEDAPRVSRAPDNPTVPYRLARWIYRRLDRGVMAETWPVSEIYVPFTWVVPANLVYPLTTLKIGDRAFPVPGRTDDYLTYRYGDWSTPVSDWCYWEDDGAIRRSRPSDELRMMLRVPRKQASRPD